MGLLDALTSIAGGASPEHHGVADALSQVMQEHPGGMDGILNQLKQNGLADQVQSWVSPGENTAISPEQVAYPLQWRAGSSPWFFPWSSPTSPAIADKRPKPGAWQAWRPKSSAAKPRRCTGELGRFQTDRARSLS
jgi:hypothetical protein